MYLLLACFSASAIFFWGGEQLWLSLSPIVSLCSAIAINMRHLSVYVYSLGGQYVNSMFTQQRTYEISQQMLKLAAELNMYFPAKRLRTHSVGKCGRSGKWNIYTQITEEIMMAWRKGNSFILTHFLLNVKRQEHLCPWLCKVHWQVV